MESRSSLVRACLVGAVGVSIACSASKSGNTFVACRALTVSSARPRPGWGGTVFTIVMENHNRSQIIGNEAAPYINGLARQYAEAAGYHDPYVHPSEPNYIWMVAGENFGILNDDDPGRSNAIASRSHVADQIERAGLSWKTYQESMGERCGLQSHGAYAVKHNPFAYFSDINGWNGMTFQPSARCIDHIVDYSELATDLAGGSLANYVFITPDLNHDMHDGTIEDGDHWLATEVPKLLASASFTNGGVLFLLWDEGANDSDDPPFIAVSPNAKSRYTSQTDYDTSAFLKTVQAILGLEPLPCAKHPDAVPVMSDLFRVPL